MTTTLTVYCPIEECGHEIELQADVEPADHYGMDRDGRRGITLPAYVTQPWTPTSCPECKQTYTAEQFADLTDEIAKAAKNADAEEEYFGPDGPDTLDEWDR